MILIYILIKLSRIKKANYLIQGRLSDPAQTFSEIAWDKVMASKDLNLQDHVDKKYIQNKPTKIKNQFKEFTTD